MFCDGAGGLHEMLVIMVNDCGIDFAMILMPCLPGEPDVALGIAGSHELLIVTRFGSEFDWFVPTEHGVTLGSVIFELVIDVPAFEPLLNPGDVHTPGGIHGCHGVQTGFQLGRHCFGILPGSIMKTAQSQSGADDGHFE